MNKLSVNNNCINIVEERMFAPVILIYQMGKVGSQSVQKSLLRDERIINKIYHVHVLSDFWIRQKKADTLKNGINGELLLEEELIKKEVDSKYYHVNWKIISLVRDPIRIQLSEFFQNVTMHYADFIDGNGKYNKDEILKYCTEMKPYPYFENWFDNEIGCVFGIDIYEYPFDHENGFSIISKNNIDVLLIRLENLNDCFTCAMEKFLGIPNVKLLNENESKNKDYHEIYSFIVKNLKLKKDSCERFYSTRLAKHFYTAEENEEFKKYWMR
jgi:hypothetical protein